MYTFDLDSEAQNDLKRLPSAPTSAGRYKLVHEWSPSVSGQNGAGQRITSLACVNSVQSPILLAATSDKYML